MNAINIPIITEKTMTIYLRIREFIGMIKVGYPVGVAWCVSGVIVKARGKVNDCKKK